MAPGPVTTAAIVMGTKSRHAGMWMAVGHGLLEAPLMVFILIGVGVLFESAGTRTVIGIIGGIVLIWMGVVMLREIQRKAEASAVLTVRGPLMTGFILSITNPYFLLWWATVGLALAKDARKLGLLAFVLFTIVHWLCDLVWLEALSWTSFKGSQLISQAHQRIVLAICAVAMLFFGTVFIYRAIW